MQGTRPPLCLSRFFHPLCAQLHGTTLAAVTAAQKLGKVTVLVAGDSPDAVAKAVSQVAGVARVLVAKDVGYAHALPENVATLVAAVHGKQAFSHIVSAHTAFGKNFMPRLSAQLDVAQVSDVMAITATDTFVRSIYAGARVSSCAHVCIRSSPRLTATDRQRHRNGQERRFGQGADHSPDIL
jgi:electron transfer flavoprotein alpha subunit